MLWPERESFNLIKQEHLKSATKDTSIQAEVLFNILLCLTFSVPKLIIETSDVFF